MAKIHFLQSPVIRAPTLLVRSYDTGKNFMSFLETITFPDVLCHQARTTKQKDWLHEIEQTAKYDCNFHDFLSDILLASNLCFQILKNSSPQVTDGLKQFSDLQLWVKLKYFSFLDRKSVV